MTIVDIDLFSLRILRSNSIQTDLENALRCRVVPVNVSPDIYDKIRDAFRNINPGSLEIFWECNGNSTRQMASVAVTVSP